MYMFRPHQIPQGLNATMLGPNAGRMGKIKVKSEVGTQNLNEARPKMTLIYAFFVFSHAFPNAIHSHLIVPTTKQPSFKFHQGQK